MVKQETAPGTGQICTRGCTSSYVSPGVASSVCPPLDGYTVSTARNPAESLNSIEKMYTRREFLPTTRMVYLQEHKSNNNNRSKSIGFLRFAIPPILAKRDSLSRFLAISITFPRGKDKVAWREERLFEKLCDLAFYR